MSIFFEDHEIEEQKPPRKRRRVDPFLQVRARYQAGNDSSHLIITIPAYIRRQTNIKHGDLFQWFLTDDDNEFYVHRLSSISPEEKSH